MTLPSEGDGWRLVHLDDDLLVVDKASGVPSQPTRDATGDLHTALQTAYGRADLLHRLDQPASGLLVFGRSDDANRSLTQALREHAVQRHYLAILVGFLPQPTLSWTTPLQGKRALSHVEVLGQRADLTAVRLSLETGRTHQLRRHAAMAMAPIAGDRRYGGPAGRRHPRLALHATTLGLVHPATGEALQWTAPLPPGLARLWTEAGGPEDLIQDV